MASSTAPEGASQPQEHRMAPPAPPVASEQAAPAEAPATEPAPAAPPRHAAAAPRPRRNAFARLLHLNREHLDSGKHPGKIVYNLIYAYMALPIVIFLLGWVRPLVAVPAVVVILIVLVRLFMDTDFMPEGIRIDRTNAERFVLAFIIILAWVYVAGIGKMVYQNSDYYYRNALFEMLVSSPWPVVKSAIIDGQATPILVTYYIGLWLPSALVGKAFGLRIAYCFLMLWSALGIWFFYYLLCCRLRKVSLLPLVAFILFSGLDAVGYRIVTEDMSGYTNSQHLESWIFAVQFSSFTTQLFWVFNQAIPAWILSLLILQQTRFKYEVFLLGISLICCPLPFIGTIPLVAWSLVHCERGLDSWPRRLGDVLSFDNIAGGGVAGLITYCYFKGNSSGQDIKWMFADYDRRALLFAMLLFVFIEAGVYCVAMYRYQKRNPLMYLSLAWLLVCTQIQVGHGVDFCMRASIPSQVVLFVLVMDTFALARVNKDRVTAAALVVLLALGAITPVHEFNRTAQNTYQSYLDHSVVYLRTITDPEVFNFGDAENSPVHGANFCSPLEGNFFYEHLARRTAGRG